MKTEPHERKTKQDTNISLQAATLAFLNSSGEAIRGPLSLGQSNTNSKLFAHAGRPAASSGRWAGNASVAIQGLTYPSLPLLIVASKYA
jgi:hypothetical protein